MVEPRCELARRMKRKSLGAAALLPDCVHSSLPWPRCPLRAIELPLGATEDLKVLNSILLRCQPPIPSNKQQDTTRYAALMAWTIIKKHSAAYDAIVNALEAGKGLSACLEAAEAAEKGQSQADKAAAVAKAEAISKETPQEKAAREREEMAARGRF